MVQQEVAFLRRASDRVAPVRHAAAAAAGQRATAWRATPARSSRRRRRTAETRRPPCAAESRSPLPISGIRLQVRLDRRDPIPIGRATEHIGRGATMNGERRRPGPFDHLRDVDRVDLVARAAQSNLRGDGRRCTGFDHALDDRSHPLRLAQQVRAAMSPLGDVAAPGSRN